MVQLISHHVRRQGYVDADGNFVCPDWTCDETAWIIKWVVIAAIVILFLGFIIIGYWHAKRRMARGQAPLRYHRWLISRQARERFFPQTSRPTQNSYAFYRPEGHGQPQQAYAMHNYGHGHGYGYAAPPPAYHEGESVPMYTPPSKVNPDQAYAAAPPGSPPPAAVAVINPQAGSSHP